MERKRPFGFAQGKKKEDGRGKLTIKKVGWE
jgi:hypothetical protein